MINFKLKTLSIQIFYFLDCPNWCRVRSNDKDFFKIKVFIGFINITLGSIFIYNYFVHLKKFEKVSFLNFFDLNEFFRKNLLI